MSSTVAVPSALRGSTLPSCSPLASSCSTGPPHASGSRSSKKHGRVAKNSLHSSSGSIASSSVAVTTEVGEMSSCLPEVAGLRLVSTSRPSTPAPLQSQSRHPPCQSRTTVAVTSWLPFLQSSSWTKQSVEKLDASSPSPPILGPGAVEKGRNRSPTSASLVTSLLVNYSVLMSDWWVLKSKAREGANGLLARAAPIAVNAVSPIAENLVAPLAGAVAGKVGSVSESLLWLPSSFLWTPSSSLPSDCQQQKPEGVACDDELEAGPLPWYAGESGQAKGGAKANLWSGWGSRLWKGREEEGSGNVIDDGFAPGLMWEQRDKDVAAEVERGPMGSPGFSYSAAGLLFPYHLGVSQCLLDQGLLKDDTPLAGSSAGALVCGVIAAGLSMEEAMDATKKLAADCRTYGTAFRLGAVLRKFMEDLIPEDAHERASGRIRVAVTQVFQSPRGLLVDKFDSKEDLLDALITSCFIPGYLAPQPATRFRDRYCIDGGVTLFMPPTSGAETVRICAFPASSFGMQGISISPDCNPVNRPNMRQLFGWALEPAEDDVLDDLFRDGYNDALLWVQSQRAELVEKSQSLIVGL